MIAGVAAGDGLTRGTYPPWGPETKSSKSSTNSHPTHGRDPQTISRCRWGGVVSDSALLSRTSGTPSRVPHRPDHGLLSTTARSVKKFGLCRRAAQRLPRTNRKRTGSE
jgi:hypothetical protein